MPAIQIIRELADSNDFVLVELQGKIETNCSSGLRGLDIGDLSLDPPVFTIGNQYLTGKLVKLKKPLAVLEPINDIVEGKRMKIIRLIKQKYVFDARPTTVFRNNKRDE